jgi:hypothetical protein
MGDGVARTGRSPQRWPLASVAAANLSLTQSAKFNGHDPCANLKKFLERLPIQRAREVDALLTDL